MKGWCSGLDGFPYEPPKGVVGIVVAQNFPAPELIREKLEEGIARVAPETVWVMREAPKSNHAVTVAWDVLHEHGVEPIQSPLVPFFVAKRDEHGYDLRRKWRDAELMSTCERIIVFHDASSNITAEWKKIEHSVAKIFVIERGKKRIAARKGRKPVGV